MLCLKTGILYSTVMKRLNALKADNKIDCEKRHGKVPFCRWFKAASTLYPV